LHVHYQLEELLLLLKGPRVGTLAVGWVLFVWFGCGLKGRGENVFGKGRVGDSFSGVLVGSRHVVMEKNGIMG
jgi:hypothetical protein